MNELKPIKNFVVFKQQVDKAISILKNANPDFETFVQFILSKTDAYVLGGFLRDVSIGKIARDLDIMIDMPDTELNKVVDLISVNYKKNRLNGYKINFHSFDMDCWSTENNWAFNKRILKSKATRLNNIANGTFLNFDSLVLSLKTLELSVKNYNNCLANQTLDIVRKNTYYKKNNPTTEANIIRCFYLSKRYDLRFSDQLNFYILDHIKAYDLIYGNYEKRLLQYYKKYSKYAEFLSMNDCINIVNQLRNNSKNDNDQLNKPLPTLF